MARNVKKTPLQRDSPSSRKPVKTHRRASVKTQDVHRQSLSAQITVFEERVRALTGCKYAIGVASRTAGLHLCVQAANILPREVVITSPFISIDILDVLCSAGVVPAFVDVEPRTGNIDPYLVFAAAQDIMLGGRSAQAWLPPKGANPAGQLKAIVVADVGSQMADLEPILNTAWKYKLKVIEDASEALGAEYKAHPAGTLSDVALLSLDTSSAGTNLVVATVVTDDDEAASLIRALRDEKETTGDSPEQTQSPAAGLYPSKTSLTLGLAYLQHFAELIAKRRLVADWYNQRLAGIPELEAPRIATYMTTLSWSSYVVRIMPGLDRDAIIEKLSAQGITVRQPLLPAHLQKNIVERFGYSAGTFPVTEDLARRSLALPFSDLMDEGQVEQVCQTLRHALR